MRLILFALATFLLLFTVQPLTTPAFAQETVEQAPLDKRKLLVPPRNADGTVKTTPFFEDPVQWMADKQREFYGSMTAALRDMVTGGSQKAAWWLMGISFLYGIFHAAGPGHGKAIVTSWILATDNDLKRGLVIAGMSALIQALTAIIAVSLLLFVFKAGAAATRNAATILEQISFAMIAAMGLYLIWTAFRPHGHAHSHAHSEPAHHHDHDQHDHHHDHAHHDHGHHDHGHHHKNHDDHHGHAHAPEPQQLRGDWSLTKAISLAFAVGIRPCTGAILVLVGANLVGLYWAGVLATLAMGLGVFLTIAAIAALSVYAKSLAMKLAAHDSKRLAQAAFTLRLLGGVAIAALGSLMFFGALKNGTLG
jgi:nickel/cobalt transporter (NicO) family protein